jgi:hypothetical protein
METPEEKFFCFVDPKELKEFYGDELKTFDLLYLHYPNGIILVMRDKADFHQFTPKTITMLLSQGYTLIPFKEFKERFKKEDKLTLFGFDVKKTHDNEIMVGCKSYSFREVNAFIRIAEDIINLTDNGGIINHITVNVIQKVVKKLSV